MFIYIVRLSELHILKEFLSEISSLIMEETNAAVQLYHFPMLLPGLIHSIAPGLDT